MIHHGLQLVLRTLTVHTRVNKVRILVDNAHIGLCTYIMPRTAVSYRRYVSVGFGRVIIYLQGFDGIQ